VSLFFEGKPPVARYDIQKYPIFERLIEKQISFFWRPEEVDISTDKGQFENLSEVERHVFVKNLQYQTLLDTVQGRSPNLAILPHVSVPELETWIETWSFSETIHSRSYTHILRNLYGNPSPVFDEIPQEEEIQKRATSINKYYDQLMENPNEDTMYLAMHAINILEGIRFYVSFACSFAFGERKLMVGNADIIKLIARDEKLHLVGTQNIIQIMKEANPDLHERHQEEIYDMFLQASNEEKEWAEYLFSKGSMLGLNPNILSSHVEYITNKRLRALGYFEIYPTISNPLPWMANWLDSGNFQTAPQEREITSYLVGQINTQVDKDKLKDFKL
jgi:ribonucleoside-diphosphate reductase beta chain